MGEGGFAGVQRHELFDGFGVGFLGLDSAGTDEGGAEIGIGQGGDGYAFAASGAVDERAAAEIDARMVAAPGMVEGDDVARHHGAGLDGAAHDGLLARRARQGDADIPVGPLHEPRTVEALRIGTAGHVGRAEGCFGLLDKMQVRQRDSRLPHRGQARRTVVVSEALLLGHGRTIGFLPVFQIRLKRVRIVVHRLKGGLQLFGGAPGKRDGSNEKGNGADGGVASFHFFGLGNFPSDVKMVTKRLSYKKNQIISVCFVIETHTPARWGGERAESLCGPLE